jgi:hypothetical protein
MTAAEVPAYPWNKFCDDFSKCSLLETKKNERYVRSKETETRFIKTNNRCGPVHWMLPCNKKMKKNTHLADAIDEVPKEESPGADEELLPPRLVRSSPDKPHGVSSSATVSDAGERERDLPD